MKPEEFLEMLSEIDPLYIEEAEQFTKKKRITKWKQYSAVAASIGVLLTGGCLLLHQNEQNSDLMSGAMENGTAEEETAGVGVAQNEENETADAGMAPENETEQLMGQSMIPETIYIGEDCYTRTNSVEDYDKTTLSYVGKLGEDTSLIHSDSPVIGAEVYQIDETRIMVEIDGKYYTYKK